MKNLFTTAFTTALLFTTLFTTSCTTTPPATTEPTTTEPPVVAPVEPDATPAGEGDIEKLISASPCAAKSWNDRGQMPKGFAKGLALTFGRSLCRQRAGQSLGKLLAQGNTGDDTRDALSWYNSNFSKLGMKNDTPEKSLRHLYVLGYGLGMRESSGKYCVGTDRSTSTSKPSNEHEAGLFQTSWNAANSEARKLALEYRANPAKCMLDVFKEGVSCGAKDAENFGSGEGIEYQRLAKSCPAFASEFAMITLRTLRKHYGPINRKEAELSSACNDILYEVEKLLTKEACGKLL